MKKLIYIVTVFVAGLVTVASALGAVCIAVWVMVTNYNLTLGLLFVSFLGLATLGFCLLDGMTPELFGVEKPVKSRRKKISRRA